MPELILNCSQCGHALRIPEDLSGRPVQCPACGLTFTAPASAAEAQPVTTHQEEYDSRADDFEDARPHQPHLETWATEETLRDRARAYLTAPAIVLLLAGILGLLADVGQAVYVAAKMRFPDPAPAQAPRDILEEVQQEVRQGTAGPLPIMVWSIFAIDSLLVIIAAIQMLRLRTYAFAVAGSVLAMINLGSLCCLLGLPAGIWALVALSRPEVKSAFH